MSSRGFLYVTENIYYAFEKELNKAFGKGKWTLNGSDYDIWDLTSLPNIMIIKVEDDEGEIIGEIEVSNRFFIEEGMGGKYIAVEPNKLVKIKKDKNRKGEEK